MKYDDYGEMDEFGADVPQCVNCEIVLNDRAIDRHCEECAKYFGLGQFETSAQKQMRERAAMQERFGKRFVDPRVRTLPPEHIIEEQNADEIGGMPDVE